MDYEKDFEDGFEQTSMGAIHYMRHRASGNKLIFLHGFGGSTRSWKRFMGYLSDDLDITLIDLLGHGKSDAPQTDYSVSMHFQVLREFIALQNNGDSFIFGHSYGGWVAAYYATQPCTCKGIILEAPAGIEEMFDDIVAAGKEDEFRTETLRMAHELTNKEWVMKSMLESSLREDQLTADMLKMIKTPALILWGGEDDLLDKKYGVLFNERIRGSRLEIIHGADHFAHFSDPGDVAESLKRFMASVK
jgi:pimeloyl-ACP methyl ester carboxylesterase